MNLVEYLIRQMAFSKPTFGPGTRTNGVLDHIEKEIKEVRKAGGSADEWIDLVILSLDGLTRQLSFCNEGDKRIKTSREIAEMACRMLEGKQDRNENREWPDWRTMSADKAIEHVRSKGEGHVEWTWKEEADEIGTGIWFSAQPEGYMVSYHALGHGYTFDGPLRKKLDFFDTRISNGRFYDTLEAAQNAAKEFMEARRDGV